VEDNLVVTPELLEKGTRIERAAADVSGKLRNAATSVDRVKHALFMRVNKNKQVVKGMAPVQENAGRARTSRPATFRIPQSEYRDRHSIYDAARTSDTRHGAGYRPTRHAPDPDSQQAGDKGDPCRSHTPDHCYPQT
jgi:hypothetical protein